MNEKQEWKRLKLYEREEQSKHTEERPKEKTGGQEELPAYLESDGREHSSKYLIARDEQQEERRKELLYRILGPVFFGK